MKLVKAVMYFMTLQEGCGSDCNEGGWYLPREHIDDLQSFFEFYGDVEHIQQGIWKRMPGQVGSPIGHANLSSNVRGKSKLQSKNWKLG